MERLAAVVPWWLTALATAALVLLSAKAHGRQIRLEREQKGVFQVDFRRQNPAVVEAIWKRDRWTLWPTFLGLAVAALLRLGFQPDLGWALGDAFALGFIVAGLASWARMARRQEGPLPWRRRAMQGSVAWWLAVAAAAALAAWSLG